MKAAGFLGCLGVEALKVRRTMALALAVLLPAAVVGMFVIYLLQNPFSVPRESGLTPASLIIQGLLTFWSVLVLPIFAAIETSLLASLEHQNRGWKHLFALPPARGALIAAKFAGAVLLIAIAHAFLFGFTLVLLWAMPKLRPGLGLEAPVPFLAILVVFAVCAVSSLFIVGVHTLISLRWPSFALNIGIALAGMLCVFVVMDTRANRFYPWSQPGATLNVVVPWIFHWPDVKADPGDLVALLAIVAGGFLVTAFGGGWLLARRDVF